MSNSTTRQPNKQQKDYDFMFEETFGRLAVLGFVAIQDMSKLPSRWLWLCECECGHLTNGVTLCGECHKSYHKWQGWHNPATKEGYDEWLQQTSGGVV